MTFPRNNRIRGVYEIRRKTDGKTYVGSSENAAARLFDHLCRLQMGNHRNKPLQAAWNERGPAGFYFDVLEVVPPDECLLSREQHYMDLFGRALLFNVCPQAGSTRGRPASQKVKEVSSRTHKGKKLAPSHVEAIRQAALRPRSEAHRRGISLALSGKPKGDGHKKALRDAAKRALTDHQKAEALRLFAAGVPIAEIGRRLGVSSSTAARACGKTY